MSLSRERIVAAKARADAATEGPWEAGDAWVYTSPIYADDKRLSNVLGMPFADPVRADAEHERGLRNAEFIAASREDVPVMADALLRILDLHTPEERAHDGSGEWSIPLSEWDDDEAPETFTVCSHCGAIEMRESQGESEFASYLEALWPCGTVRAVTGEEADRG